MKTRNPIFWVGIWQQGYTNVRRAELLKRMHGVDRYYIYLHKWKIIRGFQRYILLPICTYLLSYFYPLFFCTDRHQIKYFPRAIVYDCDDPNYSLEEIADLARPNISTIIVTTEIIRKRLAEAGIAKTIEIIPQGVDSNQIDPHRKDDYRRIWCREADEIVIGIHQPMFYLRTESPDQPNAELYVADHLLEIMASLHGRFPKAALWLVGNASEGVKNFATRRPWIRLLGYHPHSEILTIVSAFDIGVYPRPISLGGRGCLKLLEYMICRVPIVGMAVLEMEIVQQVGAGLVAGTSEEFILALNRLCKEGDLRKALGRSGYLYAAEYSWDRLSDNYSKLLKSCLP